MAINICSGMHKAAETVKKINVLNVKYSRATRLKMPGNRYAAAKNPNVAAMQTAVRNRVNGRQDFTRDMMLMKPVI